MAIIRNSSKDKYTVIDNNILKNKHLSLKARGLLVTLLSLPDNWEFSENGLEKIFNDGITSIRTALKQLEEQGYLKRKQLKDDKGKFTGNEWIVIENPLLENPITDNPVSENHTQLNTNISNTYKDNICSSLTEDFDKLWKIYPRKDGKNQAFNHYKAWINGKSYAGKTEKLTNEEMWYAIRIYQCNIKKNKIEKQYIKMGSTFFNEAIFEYANYYRENPVGWQNKIKEILENE